MYKRITTSNTEHRTQNIELSRTQNKIMPDSER
jgi:hypothetical protein